MVTDFSNGLVILNIGLSAPTFAKGKLCHVERIAIMRKSLPWFFQQRSCKMEVVPRHVYGGEPVAVFTGRLSSRWEEGMYNMLVDMEQDCCAMMHYSSSVGQLFGPHADKWGSFNPQFFVK